MYRWGFKILQFFGCVTAVNLSDAALRIVIGFLAMVGLHDAMESKLPNQCLTLAGSKWAIGTRIYGICPP